MKESVFQDIYDEIVGFLPEKWKKVVIYLEYMEGAYSFSFFVKLNEEYIKCYDLPGIEEELLLKAFKRIDKVVNTERKSSKATWSNMTMVVEESGDMRSYFDYTDLNEGSYSYKKKWKAQYLV